MTAPILVTGGQGQVALALEKAATVPLVRVGRPDFDFDRPETIETCFAATRPSLVVNAAAYTAVDAAEGDAEAAYRANRDGPATLARLCAGAGIPLIHISTDYVFNGEKPAPYVETDPTGPQGVYGASKLAGEQAVLSSGARAIILRTAWVYAPTGKNFVRTMLNLARARDTLGVVADQHGCPTAAADLAEAILAIAARIAATGWDDAYGGVFHATGTGETTWHELALAVFQASVPHGGKVPVVNAIPTSAYPTPAKRPANSRLDCGMLQRVFGLRLPPWRDSVTRTVDAIMAAEAG